MSAPSLATAPPALHAPGAEAGGQRLRTRLTAAAIAELGIQVGTSLFAVIKATAITLEAR